MIAAMGAPMLIGSQHLNTSCSIGISLYPADGKDSATLMKHADVAMYYAKENGRNNYRFFSAEMNARAQERLSIENYLRLALRRNELVLHYQPRVRLADGALTGVEALVRWSHPRRGLLAPEKFIDVAEDSGLIVPIGEWVLEHACRQARRVAARARQGFPGLGEPLRRPGRRRRAAAARGGRRRARRRHRSVHAGAGAHREHPHAEPRREGVVPQPPRRARRGHLDRRFRHRLLVARLPQDAARGRDQDRQLVRARHRASTRTTRPSCTRSSRWRTRSGSPWSPRGSRPRPSSPASAALGCDEYQGFLASPALPPAEFERRYSGAARPLTRLTPSRRSAAPGPCA